jgi:hypothetical protein
MEPSRPRGLQPVSALWHQLPQPVTVPATMSSAARRSQTNRYWGHHWYIWNNTGDRATLKNASGTVMARCGYDDPNEVRAYKIC